MIHTNQSRDRIHNLEMRHNQANVYNRDYVANATRHPASGLSFRSAAEAQLDTSSKYRQLPCKTLISIGTCPFGERCVFLHDPRLICHLSHSISRLKNKEDNVVDSFFWPLTSHEHIAGKKSDHNFRPYAVPAPKNDQYKLHDQALYSLWMHYVEFCRASAKAHKSTSPKSPIQDLPLNIFSQRPRLPVFQLLSSSNGCPIAREQFHFATFEQMREFNTKPMAGKAVVPPVSVAVSTPVKVISTGASYHASSPTSVCGRQSFGPDNSHVTAAAAKATETSSQHVQQLGPVSSGRYVQEKHQHSCNRQYHHHQPSYQSASTASAVTSLGTSSGFTSFNSVNSLDSAGAVDSISRSLFDDITHIDDVLEEEEEEDSDDDIENSSHYSRNGIAMKVARNKRTVSASPRNYRAQDCTEEVAAAMSR